MLGHEVLTYRPVNEAAQGLPGVEVRGAEGRSDVIKCLFVGLTQLDTFGPDIVHPHPDTRDWVIGCPGPGPGSERLEAGVHIVSAVVTAAPAAGEHAVKHPGVE